MSAQQCDAIAKIYSQVTRELADGGDCSRTQAEERSTSVDRQNCSTQLNALLQRHANDPETLESLLSDTQRNELLSLRKRQHDQHLERIEQRVRQKLNSWQEIRGGAASKCVPILKLRVIDATATDTADTNRSRRTAVLSVRHPDEGLLGALAENRTICVRKVFASGLRNGVLQLTAARNTQFEELHDGKRLPNAAAAQFERKVMPIQSIGVADVLKNEPFRPNFDEIDTVGIVVHIVDAAARKIQSVYMATPLNDDDVSLLCINFWSGLHAYALDDVVRVGRILAARDLQWRSNVRDTRIPTVFATEITRLTEQPDRMRWLDAGWRSAAATIAALKERLQRSGTVDEFVRKCCQRIDALNGMGTVSVNRTLIMASPQVQQRPIVRPKVYSPGQSQIIAAAADAESESHDRTRRRHRLGNGKPSSSR